MNFWVILQTSFLRAWGKTKTYATVFPVPPGISSIDQWYSECTYVKEMGFYTTGTREMNDAGFALPTASPVPLCISLEILLYTPPSSLYSHLKVDVNPTNIKQLTYFLSDWATSTLI